MSAEGRERELIAEILAAPHDDVPRLVYADWLIDRGGAWAALQRLEIAGGYQRTQVGAMLREVYGERLHFRG